jgi:TonB family protein
MAVETGASNRQLYSQTANDRFKKSSNQWFFGSIVVATVLHFGLFQFFPELTASDVSFGINEFEAIELPPEVDIPPPPEQISRPAVPVVAATELEEDITIAPTTFEENPVENLPPPPSDASRIGDRPVFQDAGIGGTVYVWLFIDTEGRVQNAQVQESSGNATLDAAAMQAVYLIEFTPALNMDKRVPVWVAFPILFEIPI